MIKRPPRGLKFALELAALGYRVFPLSWPSRVPIVKDWPNRASSDPLEIVDMWSAEPNASVGVATGPVLAIDLDEKDGKHGIQAWSDWCSEHGIDVPDVAQKTLSGGVHSLFMLPDGEAIGNSAGRLGQGIDTRGVGGYIIAYTWLPKISWISEAPKVLLDALRAPEKRERRTSGVTVRDPALGLHPYAQRAIGYELARLDECVRGGDLWDVTTFEVCCNLVEFANSGWSGYTLEQAHEDFLEHAPVDTSGFPASRRDAKWESALQTVGDGDREEPEGQYLTPEEVFDVWVEETEHKIFDATPVLQHIRQAAHSRMLGSGAVLANVLGRVLAEVPPGVVLPAVVGKAASLNLGFAMVGHSGDGKSATYGCGSEVLFGGAAQEHIETGVGSGEGLIEAFLEEQNVPDPRDPTKMIKAKVMVVPPSRIFNIDEVDQLGKVGGRDGSTIMSIMRTALTGGALKSANATAERRRSVQSESYRLVMFVGVQPALSGTLLNEADAGTPQRLLWISTVDRTVPREKPPWPGSLDWAGGVMYLDRYQVQYPDHIKQTIVEQRFERVHGRGDPLESHLMLTRLKVAAALAFLHDEVDITDQWWTISGHLMSWSKKEQDRCRAVLNEVGSATAKSRGRASVVEEDAADEMRMAALKQRILGLLSKGEATWNAVHKRVSPKQRELLEQAIEELVAAGSVLLETGEYQGQPSRKLRKAS